MGHIEQTLRKIIIDKIHVEEEKITPQAELINDLGADSLEAAELVMKIEEEFDLMIPDEQMEKFVTVQDIISYIEIHKPNLK